MKKITKEILDNQPVLEKDKDSLDKAVNFLEENNPKIIASSVFKKSLKSRLDGIIGIKQNKKSNFVSFMIPIFSFMFVIGGFFYYFKDINFFNQDGTINQSQIEKFNEQEIGEINEMVSIMSDEIDNAMQEENNKTKEFSPVSFSVKSVSKDLEDDKKITPKAGVRMLKSNFSDNNEENISEDNQLMDILESVESEIQETFDDNMQDENMNSEINSIMEIGSFGDMAESNIMFDESEVLEIEKYNFEDFCEDNSGELAGTGETLKCIKNEIECFSRDFEKNSCSFE